MDRRTGNSSIPDLFRRNKRIFCTVIMLGIGIGTILLAYAAFAHVAAEPPLRQAIFLFRHGDKAPTFMYPNDPYKYYPWEGGLGALSKKGMLQLHTLGQWIRKEYDSILDKTYDPKSVYAASSYADRCLMSAAALMAGLYPPEPEDRFIFGLPWRPVPIHSTPRDLDKVIVVKAPCPRLEKEFQEAHKNESMENPQMASYFKRLTELTGREITNIVDVELLYGTLEIQVQNGLTLPEWTKDFYNEHMRTIAAKGFALFTSNTLQQRLRGGPLLKQILGHMKSYHDGTDKRRTYFYSMHDITLVTILRTMGFRELFKPDYGATVIIELRSTDAAEEPEVQVAYLNNTETDVAHRMNIPNCEQPCLLKDWIAVLSDVTPDNWDLECLL